ncbi:N-acetylglucosaminyltransferase, partial [Ascosphaera atra]
MPRAYWIDSQPRTLGSHVLLVEPSEFEFDRVMEGKRKARENEYDMEIINKLYRDNAMVIPHRQYGLLTGEFRSRSHAAYLGSKEARFEPDKVIQEAKYVHFSDWPVPKPFNGVSKETIEKHQPKCMKDYLSNTRDCRARDIWVSLYADYAERKE